MVDLDGAKTGTSANLAVLEAVKRETSLIVDFGGGLRDEQSLNAAFDAGADMVTVGSAAIQQPNLFESWVLRFGADRIILAADVRNGLVAVSGWADTSSRSLESVLERFLGVGLKRVLITDIAKDGMLTGLSVPLYHWVKREYPNLYIIASGGVSTIENIEQVRFVGTDAVVVGKAIYEGKISLEDLVALN